MEGTSYPDPCGLNFCKIKENQRKKNVSAFAQKQLQDLQESLYTKALADARSHFEHSSKEIRQYSERFESNLPPIFEYSSLDHVLAEIHHSPGVLFGDFHSHKQAQRGFLRLLRTYLEIFKDERMALCLEMFRSCDQHYIDLFLNQKITEQEFLAKIDYEKSWGFPWPHYAFLFEFAKNNHIPIYGLNAERAGLETLKKRDRHAAQVIKKILHEHPQTKIFTLMGEHHLASEHLPEFLAIELNARKKSFVRIVANVDKYYFQLDNAKKYQAETYLKLSQKFYCVINSSPWVKWRSHSMWEEVRRSGIINLDGWEDDDDLEFTEDEFDVEAHFLEVVKTLLKFFDIKIFDSDLSRFRITRDLAEFLTLTSSDWRDFVSRIATKHGWYIDYGNQTIFLGVISVNNLAEAAGQFIHMMSSDQKHERQQDLRLFFKSTVIRSTISYLCTQILNPQKPSIQYADLLRFIDETKGKRFVGELKQFKQVAISIRRLVNKASNAEKNSKLYITRSDLYIEAYSSGRLSQTLAQIIAARFHAEFVDGKTTSAELKQFIRFPHADKRSVDTQFNFCLSKLR